MVCLGFTKDWFWVGFSSDFVEKFFNFLWFAFPAFSLSPAYSWSAFHKNRFIGNVFSSTNWTNSVRFGSLNSLLLMFWTFLFHLSVSARDHCYISMAFQVCPMHAFQCWLSGVHSHLTRKLKNFQKTYHHQTSLVASPSPLFYMKIKSLGGFLFLHLLFRTCFVKYCG